MNPQNVIDLAIAYTAESANLKDYQVPTRKARQGRKVANIFLNNGINNGYLKADFKTADLIATNEMIEIEDIEGYDYDNDPNSYIWALVPEYDAHKKANVILRRIGTMDGEILLPQEKRCENSLKINEEGRLVANTRSQMAIITKLRNYESQMKRERMRLQEQIRNGDKVYMEASGIELKRICSEMQDDLDEFLNQLAIPF